MANIKQIQKYLQRKRLDYKVIDLDKEAFTVADVVKAGIKTDDIVKTLVVRTDSVDERCVPESSKGRSSYFIALALCGNDRLDFKKVRAIFGSKTELAKPEEVLRVVGVPVGAVCPVKIGIPVYIDRKVLDLKNVHMGSGDLKHGLEMKLGDLLKAVGEYKFEELV